MGYKALKESRERKRKFLMRTVLCIFLGLLLLFLLLTAFVPPSTWEYRVALPKIEKRKEGELRMHFLDVGQGDCTLIELPDGKVLLLDGGEGTSTSRKAILRYLNALDIKEIDYLVVTHTDADHCGNLPEVFKQKKVLNAYVPLTFDANKQEYAKTYESAVKEKCKLKNPTRGVDLSVNEGSYPYALRFLYPFEEEHLGSGIEQGEDPSAVLWLDYFGTSAFFGGDSDKATEETLLTYDSLGLSPKGVTLSSTEILKVSHHGSKYSTSEKFLQGLGVETAVISCGKNNPYEHPNEETLQRLQAKGVDVYRTDVHGHLVLTASPSGEYTVKWVKK